MDKAKKRSCVDCWKVFYVNPFSRSYRCNSCRKSYRRTYIKNWKQNNKNRLRIHARHYHQNHRKDGVGTLRRDDMEIKGGHVKGFIKLNKQLKRDL